MEIVIVIVLYFTVSIHRICPTDTLNMKIVLFYLNNFLTTLALEFRMDIYFLGDITGFSNLYAGVIILTIEKSCCYLKFLKHYNINSSMQNEC